MCTSVDLASFAATVVAVTRATHPVTGRPMHTLLYRNAPAHRAGEDVGNAMILHFPARDDMTEENVIDTSRFPSCADDLLHSIPLPRGASAPAEECELDDVLIFEQGIYHVVLARDVSAVPAALERVPEEKRPRINGALFDWYAHTFPGYTLALCCFNNRQAAFAEPLLWWYYPEVEDRLLLPAVDAHDGSPPDLDALVQAEHWVILGSDRAMPGLLPVQYQDPIPSYARPFLPSHIVGRNIEGKIPNGDFIAPLTALEQADPQQIRRGILRI